LAGLSAVAGEFGTDGFGEDAGAVAGDLVDVFDLRFAKFTVSSYCPI